MMETLKKVKLKKSGGIVVEFNQPDPNDNTQMMSANDYNRIPHEDLIAAIGGLKPYLVKAHNLTPYEKWNKEMMGENEYQACDVLKKIMKENTDSIMMSVDVTGIAFSGEDENAGAIITGTHLCGDTKVSLNSPRIILARDVFKWEPSLVNQIDLIKKEVHAYLHEGKKGEPKPIEEIPGNIFSNTKAIKEEKEEKPEPKKKKK